MLLDPRSVPAPIRGTLLAVLATIGCGPAKPRRIYPPALSPADVTAAVMRIADADRDGKLSRDELAAVPGLVPALAALDADASGDLAAAEISGWLEGVKASRVALTSLSATVSQKGKPLAGVTVKLVPEPFMGGEMKAAEGVTGDDGGAMLAIPDSQYPGVNCGIYRVEIVGPGADGRPLPARFNTDTTLGVAVGGPLPQGSTVTFDLD